MESANLYDHLLYSSSSSASSSISSSYSHGASAINHHHHWPNPTTSLILDGYELERYMNETLPNSAYYTLKAPNNNWVQEIRFGDHEHYQAAGNYNNIKQGGSMLKNDHKKQDQEMIDLNYNNNNWFGGGESLEGWRSFMSNNNMYASSGGYLLPRADDQNYIMSYRNGNLEEEEEEEEGSSINHIHQSFTRNSSSLGYFHVQQSTHHHSPSNSSNKTSKLIRNQANNSRTQKLAASNEDEAAAAAVVANKKPRLSSSSPTLKVRKEKLGDRISALHRLVSPFGKTDTASVLTESIGYIQFLQNQIQTLTMSYLKSSRNKSPYTNSQDLQIKDHFHHYNGKEEEEDDDDEANNNNNYYYNKKDILRSRGLCLVPLAFTSYICSFNGSI